MKRAAIYLLGPALLLCILGVLNFIFGTQRIAKYEEVLAREFVSYELPSQRRVLDEDDLLFPFDVEEAEFEVSLESPNSEPEDRWRAIVAPDVQPGSPVDLITRKLEFYHLVQAGGRLMLAFACGLLLVVVLLFGLQRERIISQPPRPQEEQ